MKGKKLSILAFFMICMSSLYAESYRFSIVWEKVIASQTTMSIVNYDDDTALTTKQLQQVSSTQNVARIQYKSNEGGTHKLVFKATPLASDSDSTAYKYNLFFNYTESGVTNQTILEVGNVKGTTYPTGIREGTAYTEMNFGQGGDDGLTNPRYIYIQAEATQLNSMKTGVQYSSTITIERVTN